MNSTQGRALLLGAAISLVSLAAGSGCATQSDVTWQANGVPHHAHPHQAWWNYQWVYYPDVNVYYQPYSDQYHWFEDGAWQQDDELPGDLPLDLFTAKIVYVQSESPFTQHESVVAWHPWPVDPPPHHDPRHPAP